jgi:phosphate starvation-inducible membrane PsiE
MEMQCVQNVPGTILFLFYLLYFYFISFTSIFFKTNFSLPRSYATVDDNRNLVKVTKINTEEDPPQMITSKHKQTLTVAM